MLEDLNAQQRAAATCEDRHTLVLAGAGTGKTRTVVARAAHLIGRDVPPSRITLLTFTRRAAREMVERLDSMVGPASREISAGTFHHFALTTMRRMPKHFGIHRHSVIDRDDAEQLMKLVRSPLVEKGEQFPKAPQLLSLYSYARNTNRAPRIYLEQHTEYDEETIDKILRAFESYSERKRACAYLDYDDILYAFARTLHRSAETRERVQGQLDHLLVDEMQDTNPLQWLILDGLREGAWLFCVGDDAQSIYGFRGADFHNVHSFTDRIPGAQVLKLEANYRSVQPVLDLANRLLEDSTLPFDKKLTATRGTGAMPRLVDHESELDEARWIADDLIARHEEGAAWSDHMVLSRTGWGARTLEGVLVEKQIPYKFIGGTSLLQSAHVKDLLALIRAAGNPRDELAWMRYLTLWPRIGDRTAAALVEQLREASSPPEALEVLGRELPSRPEIAQAPRAVLERTHVPPAAIAAAKEQLEDLLAERYDHWERRARDLDLLERLAQRHRSLQAFIEAYTLDPVHESVASREDEEDVVTLITVHSAKGTEAPVCYLLQVQQGNYPHIRALGDPNREEEERRVLYVAMTRAADELILTRTSTQRGQFVPHGGREAAGSGAAPACFLDTIPDELIKWEPEEMNANTASDEVIVPYR